MSDAVQDAFHRSIDEGRVRLSRSLPSLLAVGMVGGLDVTMGVFGLFIVEHATGSRILGALAFPIGFIALTLAKSELFTENFLVPISSIVAKKEPARSLPRLWAGTLVMNLVGGWIGIGLVMAAFPDLRATATKVGGDPIHLGINGGSFASAVLAGVAITLLTWMEQSTESMPAKLVAAVGVAFLLAAAPLEHVVVISIEMFGALHAGASFGYADWVGVLGWSALGNVVGGVGLVTILRLVQVGGQTVEKERRRPSDAPRNDDTPGK